MASWDWKRVLWIKGCVQKGSFSRDLLESLEVTASFGTPPLDVSNCAIRITDRAIQKIVSDECLTPLVLTSW